MGRERVSNHQGQEVGTMVLDLEARSKLQDFRNKSLGENLCDLIKEL